MASINNLTVVQSLQHLIHAIKNWKFNPEERENARDNLKLSSLATANVEVTTNNGDNGVAAIELEQNDDAEQNKLKITTGKFVSTVVMSEEEGEKEGNAITGADINGTDIILKKEKTFTDYDAIHLVDFADTNAVISIEKTTDKGLEITKGIVLTDVAAGTGTGNAVTSIDDDGKGSITYVKGETFIPTSQIGIASGVAPLDGGRLVPSQYLPSYVDDVVEGFYDKSNDKFYKYFTSPNTYTEEISGEEGKIYVNLNGTGENSTYRYAPEASEYILISNSLVVGTGPNDAAAGNHRHNNASTSADGFMSKSDKSKLNGIEAGAQVNVAQTDDIVTLSETVWTDKTIGHLNGTTTKPVVVANAGQTLKQMFTNIFGTVVDDDQNLVTNPRITGVSIGSASYEYGTKINSVSVTVSKSAGNYKYGPAVAGAGWTGNYTFTGTGFKAQTATSNNDTQTLQLNSTFTVGTSSALTLNVSRTYAAATNTAKTKLGASTTQTIEANTATGSGTFNPSAQKYIYYAVTNNNNIPTSWLRYNNGTTAVTDIKIDANAGQYVWVAAATTSKYKYLRLWNEVSKSYNEDDALSSSGGTISLINAQNAEVDGYYYYSTGPRKASGEVRFKLSNSLTD